MSRSIPFNNAPRYVVRPYLNKAPATPFIKWAGGKRALIPSLAKYFPAHIGTYWEPFVGGGAVFFTMADRIDRAILSDMNEELVIAYRVVKGQVDDLIDSLHHHECHHKQDEGYFLRVRAQEPQTDLEIAARFIYLNKTCFNGLYRVNKSGQFNVPQGQYKNPSICNEDGLREASKVLAKATIRVGGFDTVVQPGADDFIYCDPPYDGCFTDYQSGGFGTSDQERLRKNMDVWVERGAMVMASNADTPLIRRIYRGGQVRYILHKVEAPRHISAKAASRNDAAELIITCYSGHGLGNAGNPAELR